MYKIKISLNAQEELENAELFYTNISIKVADKFISTSLKTYFLLEKNPYFSIRYKNYRAISISKFPYLILFEIDELNQMVYILSCFHTSQNIEKYPI